MHFAGYSSSLEPSTGKTLTVYIEVYLFFCNMALLFGVRRIARPTSSRTISTI